MRDIDGIDKYFMIFCEILATFLFIFSGALLLKKSIYHAILVKTPELVPKLVKLGKLGKLGKPQGRSYPPQSLHLPRCRMCSQSPPPPQSLHLVRKRMCSQMPLPPQSLHLLRCRP